jgi:hypothetical protein
MSQRFAGLKKVSKDPAARMLALANTKLQTKIKSPASAGVPDVLTELAAAEAYVDMLRLISVALPPRERTWWACLAGRDVLGASSEKVPPTLAAAESWVRKPTDTAKAAVRVALDTVEVDDDTALCATAAMFADGTLGPGELAHHAAPPGAAQAAALGMNLMAIGTGSRDFAAEANRLIDRALDIARGGNGKPAAREAEGDLI